MSEKIYEYKDDQDWYITNWSETESFSNFSQVSAEAGKILEDLQVALNKDGHNFPIEVTVLRYHSAYRLLVFLVDLRTDPASRGFTCSGVRPTFVCLYTSRRSFID